jgi:hypothetical protein
MQGTLKLRCARKIVGQDAAVENVVEIYQMYLAGLPPGKASGQFVVSRANGIRQDSGCRSFGRVPVR